MTEQQIYTERLRSQMAAKGIASFKALSRAARVSEWQVRQLRQGKADRMRVQALLNIAQALDCSVIHLLNEFSAVASPSAAVPPYPQPDPQNYEVFQRQVLHALETLLIQLPTAAYAAQQNPDLPAQRLLPLLKPLETLLKQWGIEAIAPVGAEVPYDPQQHQLLDGSADVGDRVRIRYTGYCQGETLLYRAKVSPVTDESN